MERVLLIEPDEESASRAAEELAGADIVFGAAYMGVLFIGFAVMAA